MAKLLGFADAVHVLEGRESRLVRALDQASGGLLLGAAVVSPAAVLGWLDARAEFARLTRELVTGLAGRRPATTRRERTERLVAAHSVVVLGAFFEELESLELPFELRELELTRREQADIGQGDAASFVAVAAGQVPLLFPYPHESQAAFAERLKQHYTGLAMALLTFLGGLAVHDRLSETRWGWTRSAILECVDGAADRCVAMVRELALQFPEVRLWLEERDHEATRHEVRALRPALAELRRLMTEMAAGSAPAGVRGLLAKAGAAVLNQPVIPLSEVPDGVAVPTLGEAYLAPRFRVRAASGGAVSGDESWWSEAVERDDLAELLAGHLTAPVATASPTLVLGQPGAGKSVLAKVLAAQLPAEDYLPILVPLREVSATADLQGQIEQAVRAATGTAVDWSTLATAADGALPVVILDGFDELLQATGVKQTDYLLRVQAFQQREADLGRAVAVVVTSRTSVIERASTVPGTVVLRLEPFDEVRIRAWLDTWNGRNRATFDGLGVEPLRAETVLAHAELAGQPLLLLMLALYDAEGNALQRASGDLSRGRLYERLLRRFAGREVAKRHPGGGDLTKRVEHELRVLSLVAFAMFNRTTQWVTQADLDRDLDAILGRRRELPGDPSLHAYLRRSELMLGRFFFIHRAQAVRDATAIHTYEFLHATFGEYLVARLAWNALSDVRARETAGTLGFGPAAAADDDLLFALLSFAPLVTSLPAVRFLEGFAAEAGAEERAALAATAHRLFRGADHARGGYGDYEPRRFGTIGRLATYTANLLVLAVAAAGEVRASALFPGSPPDDVVAAWHSQALLWHSQIEAGWDAMQETLSLERLWDEGVRRDVRLTFGTSDPPPVKLAWSWPRATPEQRLAGASGRRFRQMAHWQCGEQDDLMSFTLEPLLRQPVNELPASVHTLPSGELTMALRLLTELWALPAREGTSPEEHEAAFVLVLETVRLHDFTSLAASDAFFDLFLAALSGDDSLGPEEKGRLLAASWGRSGRLVEPQQLQIALPWLVGGGPKPTDADVGRLLDHLEELAHHLQPDRTAAFVLERLAALRAER